MQLTKQIGEYLASAELCRNGFIATTFTGNVPEFDILAIDNDYVTIPLQVKAIRGEHWQLDAGRYLEIEKYDGVQKVMGKSKLPYSDLVCVFVRIVSQGKDEFYIFKQSDLQNIIFKNYKNALKKYAGKRPRNPNSTHATVSMNDLKKFRNNWFLLKSSNAYKSQ